MCPPRESDRPFPSCSKNWATGQTSRDLEEEEGGGVSQEGMDQAKEKPVGRPGGVVSRMSELPVWMLARFSLQTLTAAS